VIVTRLQNRVCGVSAWKSSRCRFSSEPPLLLLLLFLSIWKDYLPEEARRKREATNGQEQETARVGVHAPTPHILLQATALAAKHVAEAIAAH